MSFAPCFAHRSIVTVHRSATLPYIVHTDQSRTFIDLYAGPRLFIDRPSDFPWQIEAQIE
jgi:hypothetical protein